MKWKNLKHLTENMKFESKG